jgi:hypothetical protein
MNMGKYFIGMSALLALGVAGCSAADEPSSDSLGEQQDELLLAGQKFDNGQVHVCFANGTAAQRDKVVRVLADSWAKAAKISFTQFDTTCSTFLNESVIKVTWNAGAGNNFADGLGKVNPTIVNGNPVTGFRNITLRGTEGEDFQRYAIIHEFGHALGFAHEQQRDDNNGWCTEFQLGETHNLAGTFRTPFINSPEIMNDAIMSYCNVKYPWGNGAFIQKTWLSAMDVLGALKTYGKRTDTHGFMIKSDTNSALALRGGLAGANVTLSSACTKTDPLCTWSYRDGMIVSDADPSLSINAFGGAVFGTTLKVMQGCMRSNPDCTWTYSKGQFLSDRNQALAVNAFGGAANGTVLKLHNACNPNLTDCTWTIPNIMISDRGNTALKWNAFGGPALGTPIRLHQDCNENLTDCTWTLKKGMIVNDTNATFAINAFGGAANLTALKLHNGCTAASPDCTFTWSRGMLVSDRNKALGVNAFGGSVHGANMTLNSACTADHQSCGALGLFAKL